MEKSKVKYKEQEEIEKWMAKAYSIHGPKITEGPTRYIPGWFGKMSFPELIYEN